MIFPPVLGSLIELLTVFVVPVALFVLNAVCLTVIWWIVRKRSDESG